MENEKSNVSPVHARAGERILCHSKDGEPQKIDWVKDNFVLYTRFEFITCPACRDQAKELLNIKDKQATPQKEVQPTSSGQVRLVAPLRNKSNKTTTVFPGKPVVVEYAVATLPVVQETISVPSTSETLLQKWVRGGRKFYDGVDISPGKSPHHLV